MCSSGAASVSCGASSPNAASRCIAWRARWPLGPIPSDEFGPLLRTRFAGARSQITAQAIDERLGITADHPNDTQEVAHFTWARAVADGRPTTPATVRAALSDVVTAESARFVLLWESLTPIQRPVLSALAAMFGRGIYSQHMREEFQLPDATVVPKALRRLTELELVDAVGRGSYRVTDAFFAAWLSRPP